MKNESNKTNQNSKGKVNYQNKKHDRNVKREEPRKDGKSKRVNYDNTREDKFRKDMRVKGIKAEEGDFDQVNKQSAGKENDIGWYNKVPALYTPATNLSFQPVTGYQIKRELPIAVPGLMTFYWSPTLGAPDLQAVNQIKESLYSFVVHANSRNTSYDANDLFMVFVASGNVFSYLATLIRAYGVMRNFKAENKNTPQELVTAMGFNYDDFVDNYPNMLFEINRMITASRQLWCPNHFTFVTRWFWLNSNIYMDANSPKSQYYMHVQDVYWMYSEDSFNTGTALIPVVPGTTASLINDPWRYGMYEKVIPASNGSITDLLSWNDAMQFFWKLLNPLVNSTYRGVMMGDILKAYGPNDLFAVATIDASYEVVPVHSAEVLSQIENMTVLPGLVNIGLVQDQDSNAIKPLAFFRTETVANVTPVHILSDTVLNFHSQTQPSADELMIATRLKAQGAYDPAGSSAVPIRGAVMSYSQEETSHLTVEESQNWTNFPMYTGSEVITGIHMFGFIYNTGSVNSTLYNYFGYNDYTNIWVQSFPYYFDSWDYDTDTNKWSVGNANITNLLRLEVVNAFDWAPWIYEIPATYTGTPWFNAIGDWDYWGIIPDSNIGNMHTAALYSQLNVPFMG